MKFIMLLVLLTTGCSLNQNPTIERANLYYRVVKTLVNEPEIRSKLTQAQIYSLVEIEAMKNEDNVLTCVAKVCHILLELDPERKNEIKCILMASNLVF